MSVFRIALATAAGLATPALAQTTGEGTIAAASTDARDTIIVTATRRASPLSDVPVAVTAVTARQLAEGGVTDIRQLNQLAPSLLVSSTSSEAAGGGARIRGIGTVGDNAGLESSVATFVDGVYRSRSGVAFTELGPLERVEVLRGPQGTLFGRNASAGLINIVTARPQFTRSAYADASYGNYDFRRFGAGFTGPAGDSLAYRVDGVWTKRDGFIKEAISGRRLQNRDRWLARGKLLYQPADDLSLLVSADYSKRNEECCAGPYLPAADVTSSTPGLGGGTLVFSPSSTAALLRRTTSTVPGAGNGQVLDNTYARRVTLTPGRSFRQDVEDYGASAELNARLGGATLTSITAWRSNTYIKGQDADFSLLDLTVRPDDGSGFTRFRTFTQELRLQGKAFDDRLDWLVGGYYAHERLTYVDNIRFGGDFEPYAAARIGGASPAFAIFPQYGFTNLRGFVSAFADTQLAANPLVPAADRAALVGAVTVQVVDTPLANRGALDRFRQKSDNFALFTHNIVELSDRLSLTLGARYTHDRKALDADLTSDSGCGTYAANITRLRALAAGTANPALAQLAGAIANNGLAGFTGLACVVNSVNASFRQKRSEGEWSGTAVLSYKPTDTLLTYASFSRGYKAGGFNLDRAALFNTSTLSQRPQASLGFEPETVNAYEIGMKWNGPGLDVNVAAFRGTFANFQLNTFNGLNFFVSNIEGCKTDLGTRDSDAIAGNSPCADTRSGVVSKGVEIDATVRPARDLALTAGFAYADTRYRRNIVGSPDPATGDNSLQPALFLLPGSQLSNAPRYVVTTSGSWTPPVGNRLKGLVYADLRYTSDINTGSDLIAEKAQDGFVVVNARLGIGTADGRWSVELWAQNLFDENYSQVAFSMPLQGGGVGQVPGTSAAVQAFGTSSTQLFGAFLGEPRTWGLTVRTRF